jgi:hypothetical protein
MGLLISDTMLIDRMLDDTLRLRAGLGAWAYALDVARDAYEHEAAELTERTRPSRGVSSADRDASTDLAPCRSSSDGCRGWQVLAG